MTKKEFRLDGSTHNFMFKTTVIVKKCLELIFDGLQRLLKSVFCLGPRSVEKRESGVEHGDSPDGDQTEYSRRAAALRSPARWPKLIARNLLPPEIKCCHQRSTIFDLGEDQFFMTPAPTTLNLGGGGECRATASGARAI